MKPMATNGVFAALCWALCCAGLVNLPAQTRPAWAGALGVTVDDAAVSSVSAGGDQKTAENQALAQLTAYFKQSVSTRISLSASERQVNGASVGSTTEASQTIEAVSALDALMGAQTEAWRDDRAKTWYARAALDKAEGRRSYAAELDKALAGIAALIDRGGGLTFESAGRCGKAAALVEQADMYALVLSMLDGPDRRAEVTAAAAAVREARQWAAALPVDVRVTGDVNGRIKAAFAAAFAAAGYQTGGRSSRYVLTATLTLSPSSASNRAFASYVIDAALLDTESGAALFTYTLTGREGHRDQAQANNRAVIVAEQKIAAGFPEALREYLERAAGLAGGGKTGRAPPGRTAG